MNKKELFKNFEQNWGRFISPFEMEDISKWIDEDGFPIEVVNEALRETVIYDVRNLHYLNRVLAKWKASNILTVEAVQYARKQWQEQKLKSQPTMKTYPSQPASNVPSWAQEEDKPKPPTEAGQKRLAETKKRFLAIEEMENKGNSGEETHG